MIEIVGAPPKRIKVLWISDILVAASGVGTQSRYIIDGLSKTGKFEFINLGGAIKHRDYKPFKYNDCTTIYPVDGYGNADIVRSVIRTEKPDICVFFTDPRFFTWLFAIENEIRPFLPMVYYMIWDAAPPPTFNRKYYTSCDALLCISKITHEFAQKVAPEIESHYVPHSIEHDTVFKRHPDNEVEDFRKLVMAKSNDPNNEKFIFFWNNRNARRKQSGSLVWWFADFLDKVGKDKAVLVMHTDPRDPNGQDLIAIMEERGLTNGEVIISNQKLDGKHIALFNNIADCGITISDAEGFGLSACESLACETPMIATRIGGLQDQIIDPDTGEIYGVAIEPSSRAIIGSLDVPFIEENRCSQESVVSAMLTMYNMSKEQRRKIGKRARQHILKNFNFKNYIESWDKHLTNIYNERGSWDTRKQHERFTLTPVE